MDERGLLARLLGEMRPDMVTDGHLTPFTFLWEVENISCCWKKEGQPIRSRLLDTAGTKWHMHLYPRGYEFENYIELYLYRSSYCSAPGAAQLLYNLSFLDENNSVLTQQMFCATDVHIGSYAGPPAFETREKVFDTEKKTFLPRDTLKVSCTIWMFLAQPRAAVLSSSRTAFQVERRCFSWKIDEFSQLRAPVINNYTIVNSKDCVMEFDLLFNKKRASGKTEYTLNIDKKYFDECITYFMFRASIIGPKAKKVDCGRCEYFASDLAMEMSTMLRLPQDILERKKNLYLPNDVLFLDCEYAFSTGSVISEVVRSVANPSNFQKTANELPPLANDLKSMYSNGALCDTELRTPTQTFPAHKAILSARSPVFRSMFCHDMKEKNSGHVDITDLEDDTVKRMLLYMYSDTLGDVNVDTACKLYTAADKYDIQSLKSACSSFITDKMCPQDTYNVLLLSDRHQDRDLKIAVKEYISQHQKEIFCTNEWKKFMAVNANLAAEVMYWNFSTE